MESAVFINACFVLIFFPLERCALGLFLFLGFLSFQLFKFLLVFLFRDKPFVPFRIEQFGLSLILGVDRFLFSAQLALRRLLFGVENRIAQLLCKVYGLLFDLV